MGKVFAVVLTLITLVSIAFFAMHTWWLPPDISTTGKAVDHQLDETLVGTGVLFLAGQLMLGCFAWTASGKTRGTKIKAFPGGATPLITAAIIVVGIEIFTLTFVGSKAWGAIYLMPAEPGSLRID